MHLLVCALKSGESSSMQRVGVSREGAFISFFRLFAGVWSRAFDTSASSSQPSSLSLTTAYT